MRIIYIASTTVWGGATAALVNIIKGVKSAHQIHVICPYPEGKLTDVLKDENIPYSLLKYGLSVYPRTKNPLKWLKRSVKFIIKRKRVFKEMEREILSLKPDIVHTNVGPLGFAADICYKYHIPHVWHLREYQDKDFGLHFYPNKKAFLSRIHRDYNYNIAITRGIFSYWQLRNDVDQVIYDGVFDNKSLVRPIATGVESPYFLFVGRIEEAKGVYELLVAYKSFRHKNKKVRLMLAGQFTANAYYNSCLQYVHSNNLVDSVIFLGQRNDVYKLMQGAKALIVPSKFEGFGFITVEAMLNDCIVIGNDTAGTKEQFDIGLVDTGEEIALRYHTNEELVSCMERAMTEDFEIMKKKARTVVLNRYSIQMNVANILMFYNGILDKRR